jgi:uncharacterized protein YxjI
LLFLAFGGSLRYDNKKGGEAMELRIKQRVFSWSDTYDVYDESGEARYYVRAEILALGHQIHVYDKRSGREIGSVHQRLLTLTPEFEIVIGGQSVGTIRRKLTFFMPKYEVDFKGWEAEGDLFHWDYTVRHGDRQVMQIQKEWLTWGDTYVLRYGSSSDEIPGLMLVIAIDAANCNKK